MKVQLRAGAELDVLTPQELAAELDKLPERLRGLQRPEPRWYRIGASGATDGSGNALVEVFRIGQGQEFRAQRVMVEVDGHDAGTPSGTGGFQLLRDDAVVDVYTGGKLPGVLVSPDGAGARFRNGALLEVQILNGPVDAAVNVMVEGTVHVGAP